MRFLLDTNVCVHAINRKESVIQRVLSHRRPEMVISAVSEAELRYGAAKSNAPHERNARLDRFLAAFEVLDFTPAEAEVYGDLRVRLERAGTPIGPLDTMIAAHAKALDLVLVTANEREFRRVPGLRVENWATA
jgi:tRNA(fMet)-specific endonuclease VapC